MPSFLFLMGLFSIFTANAFESAPSMILVDSTYSGHEEITRQALNNTAKRLQVIDASNSIFDITDLQFNLKPEPKGLFGYKAKNVVIIGNFASDFPKQTSVLSLAEFWNNKGISNFEDPKSQVLHFLRNYTDSVTLASAYETCVNGKKNIKHITTEAIKLWRQGDKTKALFLIGHATHMIQDSFSPAHTIRAGDEENNDLKQICYFGNQMLKKIGPNEMDGNSKLCYHKAPDSKDSIWNSDPARYKSALKNWSNESVSQCDKLQQYPETEEAKNSCLSNESRLAKIATEKFLLLVFGELSPSNMTPQSPESFVESFDQRLFEGPVGNAELDRKMPNGIIKCDNLSKNRIIGMEPMQN